MFSIYILLLFSFCLSIVECSHLCSRCDWLALIPGTDEWCRCCGNDCNGFRDQCISNGGFCQSCDRCARLSLCARWMPQDLTCNTKKPAEKETKPHKAPAAVDVGGAWPKPFVEVKKPTKRPTLRPTSKPVGDETAEGENWLEAAQNWKESHSTKPQKEADSEVLWTLPQKPHHKPHSPTTEPKYTTEPMTTTAANTEVETSTTVASSTTTKKVSIPGLEEDETPYQSAVHAALNDSTAKAFLLAAMNPISGATPSPTEPVAICGNGILEGTEECDPGPVAFQDASLSPCCNLASCTLYQKKDERVCRAAFEACDAEEICDGVSDQCPRDLVMPETHVCRPSALPCDQEEYCTGDITNKTCPRDTFLPEGTVCREAAGVCDRVEKCGGDSPFCPPQQFKSSHYVCRAASVLPCDAAERCTGTGAHCPPDSVAPSTHLCLPKRGPCELDVYCDGTNPECGDRQLAPNGTICRESRGICDIAEVCNGIDTLCPIDVVSEKGIECRSKKGFCDVAEFCNGVEPDCPNDDFEYGAVCREAVGICDVPEKCDGMSPLCPPNRFKSHGIVCNFTTTECKLTESCTGTSPDCPNHNVQPAGYLCDDGNDCTEQDRCNSDGTCAGKNTCDCLSDSHCVADNPCVTGRCVDRRCEYTTAIKGTMCREAVGPCDKAEVCDGKHDVCPPDKVRKAGVQCYSNLSNVTGEAALCGVDKFCDGVSGHCPDLQARPQSFKCRVAAGPCDIEEHCDGSSEECPVDRFKNSSVKCYTAKGPCEIDAYCTGNSPECPAHFKEKGEVCRKAAGPCDRPEVCSGDTFLCPEDAFRPKHDVCRAKKGDCDQVEFCSGISPLCPADAFLPADVTCRPAISFCDIAEVCDGISHKCPDDKVKPAGEVCEESPLGPCSSDGICDGISANCTGVKLHKGKLCRASRGECDLEEYCDGVSPACPEDLFKFALNASGEPPLCREPASTCDEPEFCSKDSPVCPPDAVRPTGFLCDDGNECTSPDLCNGIDAECRGTFICTCAKDRDCDDGNPCTVDKCNVLKSQSSGSKSKRKASKELSGVCEYAVAPNGTVCRPSSGDCDIADVCNGVDRVCPADRLKDDGDVCRPAWGECDIAEVCTGRSRLCPADLRKKAGSVCRAPVGDCDFAEKCDGIAADCPKDVIMKKGTVCRDSSAPCDGKEHCDGISPQCPHDHWREAGFECRPAVSVCDVAEFCTGLSIQCPEDIVANTSVLCRASAGECDKPEYCTGRAPTCPADLREVGKVCREAKDKCDRTEFCDGVGVSCPTEDHFEPAGVICRESAGPCDHAERCNGHASQCPKDSFLSAGTVCRPERGDCDVEDSCNGTSPLCPPDAVKSADTRCRIAADICDIEEYCDGANPSCPADLVKHENTVCRESKTECDVEERCDGRSTNCPPDSKKHAGTACSEFSTLDFGFASSADPLCRKTNLVCLSNGMCGGPRKCHCTRDVDCDDNNPCSHDHCVLGHCEYTPGNKGWVCREKLAGIAGSCDVEERCDGISMECPVDQVQVEGALCRDARGECDLAEKCDGVHKTCPPEEFKTPDVICREAAGDCDVAEHCTGSDHRCPVDQLVPSSVACRPAQTPCDVPELCSGLTADCPDDVKVPDGASCDDGEICTVHDRCQNGECTSSFACECQTTKDCDRSVESECVEIHCVVGRCTERFHDNRHCDDGNRCTEGDTCMNGVCRGELRCPAGPVNGTSELVPCSGRGVCCAGTCDCKHGYTGTSCQVQEKKPSKAAPPKPRPTDKPVHQPPNSPHAKEGTKPPPTPAPRPPPPPPEDICGAGVGDSDHDGLADCLDVDHRLDRYNWPTQILVYNSTKVMQTLARVGLPAFSISVTPFNSPVTLSIHAAAQPSHLDHRLHDPKIHGPALSFAFSSEQQHIPSPLLKPVQLCLLWLGGKDRLKVFDLCLATANRSNTGLAQWYCVDTELSPLPTSDMLCGNTASVVGTPKDVVVFTLMAKNEGFTSRLTMMSLIGAENEVVPAEYVPVLLGIGALFLCACICALFFAYLVRRKQQLQLEMALKNASVAMSSASKFDEAVVYDANARGPRERAVAHRLKGDFKDDVTAEIDAVLADDGALARNSTKRSGGVLSKKTAASMKRD